MEIFSTYNLNKRKIKVTFRGASFPSLVITSIQTSSLVVLFQKCFVMGEMEKAPLGYTDNTISLNFHGQRSRLPQNQQNCLIVETIITYRCVSIKPMVSPNSTAVMDEFYPLPKPYVEVLTPSTSECDCIWGQRL